MFGYVRVNSAELKVKEYELYRGAYCGLCRAMGKCTGQCSRMSLSYDFAFLVMARLAPTNKETYDSGYYQASENAVVREKPQEWAYCGSPYGDIYDVVIPETPSGPVKLNVLKNYRAFFMNGEHAPSKALAKRLEEYVRGGGTLIINTRQLGKYFSSAFLGAQLTGKTFHTSNTVLSPAGKKLFTLPREYEFDQITLKGARILLKDSSGNILACANTVGKGKVILTTPCMLIHKNAVKTTSQHTPWVKFPFINWILDNLVKDLVPVTIDKKEIQYGLNILKDGVLLYLFNNEGVNKTAVSAEKLDPGETRNVQVGLKNWKAASVKELRSGKVIKVDKKSNSFQITIGPGDVAIVKIPVRDLK